MRVQGKLIRVMLVLENYSFEKRLKGALRKDLFLWAEWLLIRKWGLNIISKIISEIIVKQVRI